MKRDITKKYTNGEVTIVWKPGLCIHSGNCFRGLPEVFKPSERPWITPEGSSTQAMIDQVKKCPSGALSYFMNAGDEPPEETKSVQTIEVIPNGPLVIRGGCTITLADGRTERREGNVSLCRCGQSANKPFCDSTHRKIGFEG